MFHVLLSDELERMGKRRNLQLRFDLIMVLFAMRGAISGRVPRDLVLLVRRSVFSYSRGEENFFVICAVAPKDETQNMRESLLAKAAQIASLSSIGPSSTPLDSIVIVSVHLDRPAILTLLFN